MLLRASIGEIEGFLCGVFVVVFGCFVASVMRYDK